MSAVGGGRGEVCLAMATKPTAKRRYIKCNMEYWNKGKVVTLPELESKTKNET